MSRSISAWLLAAFLLASPLAIEGQQRASTTLAHEITHVVQQSQSAVLTLDSGARLTVPPGAASGSRLTFRRVARATLPARHEGFTQIGDSLVVEGTLRGSVAGVTLSMPATVGTRPRGARLVLVARLEPARVGGSGTNEMRMNDTAGSTARSGHEEEIEIHGVSFQVTPARYDNGRIEAVITADGRFASLHFGWLAASRD